MATQQELLEVIAREHATAAAEYRRHKLLFDTWSSEIDHINANLNSELERLRQQVGGFRRP